MTQQFPAPTTFELSVVAGGSQVQAPTLQLSGATSSGTPLPAAVAGAPIAGAIDLQSIAQVVSAPVVPGSALTVSVTAENGGGTTATAAITGQALIGGAFAASFTAVEASLGPAGLQEYDLSITVPQAWAGETVTLEFTADGGLTWTDPLLVPIVAPAAPAKIVWSVDPSTSGTVLESGQGSAISLIAANEGGEAGVIGLPSGYSTVAGGNGTIWGTNYDLASGVGYNPANGVLEPGYAATVQLKSEGPPAGNANLGATGSLVITFPDGSTASVALSVY